MAGGPGQTQGGEAESGGAAGGGGGRRGGGGGGRRGGGGAPGGESAAAAGGPPTIGLTMPGGAPGGAGGGSDADRQRFRDAMQKALGGKNLQDLTPEERQKVMAQVVAQTGASGGRPTEGGTRA